MLGGDMTPEHFQGEISARLTLAGVMLESAVAMARNRDPESATYRNLKKIFDNYRAAITPPGGEKLSQKEIDELRDGSRGREDYGGIKGFGF